MLASGTAGTGRPTAPGAAGAATTAAPPAAWAAVGFGFGGAGFFKVTECNCVCAWLAQWQDGRKISLDDIDHPAVLRSLIPCSPGVPGATGE